MSLQRPLVHFFASAVGLSSPAISAGLALTAGVSASPALIVSATMQLEQTYPVGLIFFESQVFYKCGFGVFERYLEAREH